MMALPILTEQPVMPSSEVWHLPQAEFDAFMAAKYAGLDLSTPDDGETA